MKKLHWISLGIIATGGILFFFFGRNSTVQISSDTLVNKVKHPLSKIFFLPHKKGVEAAKQKTDYSPECRDFWGELQNLSLDNLEYPPKISKIPTAACKEAPPEFKALQETYFKACADFSVEIPTTMTEKDWQDRFVPCLTQLYFMRAAVGVWLASPPKDLSQIQDLEILTDLFAVEFSKFFDGQFSTNMEAVANRILEIDPGIIGAQKGIMIQRILSIASNPDKKPSDEFWNSLSDIKDRIAHLAPDDPELANYQELIDTKGFDPETLKRITAEKLRQNPSDDKSLFYLAYAEWRSEERGKAMLHLKEALRLSPQNGAYQEAWNAIHKPGALATDFKISMQFGMRFSDILR